MDIIRQKIVDLNTVIVGYLDTTSVSDGDASELLPIKLLGATAQQRGAGYFAGTLLGEVNTIQLIGIMAACDSTDWNLKLLTVNDINELETIHEVAFYENINKSFSDFSLNNFFIQNEDVPVSNYLYAYVDNANGGVATGNINIVLYYKPIY